MLTSKAFFNNIKIKIITFFQIAYPLAFQHFNVIKITISVIKKKCDAIFFASVSVTY